MLISAFLLGAACIGIDVSTGTCVEAGIQESQVTLGVDVTYPGSPEYVADAESPVPFATCEYLVVDRCLADWGHHFDGAVQPITLADIAAFAPAAGLDSMQPNGWTVTGLDTNFYASAPIEVVDGSLLGVPASVRFTPVSYTWDYGDGAARTSPIAGSPWSIEFDPTPTGHVYADPGHFVITLSIEYAAEYRFASGPWLPIAGTLTRPTNVLEVDSGDATTVLVDRDCGVNPAGPGC